MQKIDQYGRVADLIHDASLTYDVSEKLELLYQVKELILNFDRSLLNVFYDEVVAFHLRRYSDLKLFVVKFIEEACLADSSLIPRSIVTLCHLYGRSLHAEPPVAVVLKTIVESMQVIYSLSLSQFLEEFNGDTSAVENFHSVCKFRNEIFSLFIPLPGASLQSRSTLNQLYANLGNKVRIAIVKFVEMVIIKQSSIPSNFTNSIDQTPNSAVVINSKSSQLLTEAELFLTGLQNVILNPEARDESTFKASASFLGFFLDSFASIAKHCPQFFGKIVQFFKKIQRRLPFIINQNKVESTETRLKSILLTLLSYSKRISLDHQNRIISMLNRLGATRFEITYGISLPDSQFSCVTPDEKEVKLCGLDSSISSESCESTRLDEITHNIIPKLTPLNVTDLLILSMANLPSELPSNFNSPIPFGDPKVHIRPLASLLASELVSWSKSCDSANQILLSQFLSTKSPKKNTINIEKLVQPIPSYRRRAYKEGAFKRILAFNPSSSYPKVFSKCPVLDIKEEVRSKMILKLALRTPKLSDLHKVLLENAMSKPEENFDVLMGLLTHEYLKLKNVPEPRNCPVPMDAGGGIEGLSNKYPVTSIGSKLNSYEVLFNRILHRISERSVKKPYLNRFFLESPSYPPDVMDFFRKFCSVPEQAEYGFEIIRTLLEIKSSQWREKLLNLLFAFSAFEEPAVRNASIKATWKLADSSSYWEKVVEERAVGLMKRILQREPTGEMFSDLCITPPALIGKWTRETFKPCSHLFFGILPRKLGRLLPLLAEIFVAGNTTIQTFILQNMNNVICQISLLSPRVLSLIKHCPHGAESLVIRILHSLTDPKKVTPERPNVQIMPPPAIVKAMLGLCRKCGNDARFIIPGIVGLNKAEVIEFLPRIFQLGDTFIKLAISRLLKASFVTQPPPDPYNSGFNHHSHSENANGELLTPADLLVAIHLLEFVKIPKAEGQTSKKVGTTVNPEVIQRAISYCLNYRQIFTPNRLVKVINRILDHRKLPKVLVFTLLQALDSHSKLSDFALEFLLKMIKKQVWNTKQLWDGFIQCCLKIKNKCYEALLMLPPKQLRGAFELSPELHSIIQQFVEKFSPANRARVPREVLKALQLDVTSSRQTAKSSKSGPR